jgi:hypothetical protein
MQVSIKKFDIDMPVKANGMELGVRSKDGKQQLGDCYVTMVGLIWCKGQIIRENGIKLAWEDIIEICKSKETVQAAVKAAKEVQ